MPDENCVEKSPESSFAYERENEAFYRQLRTNELKDDLSIRVMNLPDDRFTDKVKELAAKYLESRF